MSILLVEDKASLREMLKTTLTIEGFSVLESDNILDAKHLITTKDIDLLITDLRLPDGSGIDLLKFISANNKLIPTIVMTAFATIEAAVTAMKLGASEFLTKPVDPDLLLLKIQNVLDYKALQNENIDLKRKLTFVQEPIGISAIWARIIETACKIAESDANVLLNGESGVGKELIARFIHEKSPRNKAPYIVINCAAIPTELMESELFGSEKGAYTGSIKRKQGLFELADKGTVFLDEIGDLAYKLQAKVLRVIQEKNFTRVGGETSINIDVRIIAATNKDLQEAIKSGSFREDLFYRLNVLPITIPPLRMRQDDIPILAECFLKKACSKLNKSVPLLDADYMKMLQNYTWPGNVRELENLMERVAILGSDSIRELCLDLSGETSNNIDYNDLISRKVPLGEITKMVTYKTEKNYIISVLRFANRNKARAAQLLSISYKTLFNKLKEYNISDEEI
ncbi:MAG: sigma-54-dependent Fis family transcriptional regulator [Candidatus Coatesbacteria bacterium]|nr:sigma-54-dependent Fis family transcriptional regulator [Candidatus Coatesbacteria bacterium]